MSHELQPAQAVAAETAREVRLEADEDSFVLPPPVVEIPDDGGERSSELKMQRWGSIATDAVDSEDDLELDADEVTEDMVRSPHGTRWVKASRFFRLDTSYTIWFDPGQQHFRKRTEQEYEDSLQQVGVFSSVQDFWRYWNAIDLQKVSNNCSLSLFKDSIKPMWEDPGNQDGGQWIFRCNDRKQAEEYFTKLALALIGGYFECHESLCGVILTTKPKSNTLGIWGSKTDRAIIVCMDCELRELLGLEGEEDPALVFKEHKGVRVKSGENGDKPTEAVAAVPVHTREGAPVGAYSSQYNNGPSYAGTTSYSNGHYTDGAGYAGGCQYVQLNGGGYTYAPYYQGNGYASYGAGDGTKGGLQADQWWG